MLAQSKRVYVKSFGCSANLADGEVIAGCISDAGFEVVDDPKNADVLVYNTCAVKSPTENRIIDLLKRAPKGKHLVVAGCLPAVNFERLKREVNFDGVLGPAPAGSIVDVLLRVVAGENVISLKTSSTSGLLLPRIPANPFVSVLPISYGCLGNCAYCCVRFARGKLRSSQVRDVVERVKRDLAVGIKEVWLTSQDTACYGQDIGTNLVELLKAVCVVDADFLVRVGMMNPNHALGLLDGLVDSFKSKKVFKFLHLPVQSGDDEVLKIMNRAYSSEEFKTVVKAFRGEFPQLTLSTDVICGFPGENVKAFDATKRLIAEVKPDVVNVSKFFTRPGTPAEKLTPLSPKEVSRRSREIAKLSRQISFERNKLWIGWEGGVFFDEKGKGGSWVGRNFAYKPVVVQSRKSLLGKSVRVRVIDAHRTYLEAEIL